MRGSTAVSLAFCGHACQIGGSATSARSASHEKVLYVCTKYVYERVRMNMSDFLRHLVLAMTHLPVPCLAWMVLFLRHTRRRAQRSLRCPTSSSLHQPLPLLLFPLLPRGPLSSSQVTWNGEKFEEEPLLIGCYLDARSKAIALEKCFSCALTPNIGALF